MLSPDEHAAEASTLLDAANDDLIDPAETQALAHMAMAHYLGALVATRGEQVVAELDTTVTRIEPEPSAMHCQDCGHPSEAHTPASGRCCWSTCTCGHPSGNFTIGQWADERDDLRARLKATSNACNEARNELHAADVARERQRAKAGQRTAALRHMIEEPCCPTGEETARRALDGTFPPTAVTDVLRSDDPAVPSTGEDQNLSMGELLCTCGARLDEHGRHGACDGFEPVPDEGSKTDE